MGRYAKIADWLGGKNQDRIELTFSEIERITGAPLPPSGAQYPAFWSTGHHVARILKEAGWRARADLKRRLVEFRRDAPPPSEEAGKAQATRTAELSKPTADVPDLVLVGCVDAIADAFVEFARANGFEFWSE